MKEKYRLASMSYFTKGLSHLLALFLLGLAMIVWSLFAILVMVLLLPVSGWLGEEVIFSVFFAIIIAPFFIIMGLGMSEEGGFDATLSEVTFHVFFLKWTFPFSEIDDIQVETKHIVEGRRHSRHYFAEKITIVCGGKKRSFYGKMDCNVDSIINNERCRLHNQYRLLGQDAPTYRQRLAVEMMLKKIDTKADQLEHSRFRKLKRFIEENQKYI